MVFGVASLPLLLPVLWAWSNPPTIVGDAFGGIQLMLFLGFFPFLAVASFLVVGVLVGKSMCGWVCPFGFVQDLINYIRRKKWELSPRTHDTLLYGKYVVLGTTLFISITLYTLSTLKVGTSYIFALGVFAPGPFSALSPGETLFGLLPIVMDYLRVAVFQQPFFTILSGLSSVQPIVWVQFFIMSAVLVFAALVPRGWCKYFCPHGAIMAILNGFSFIGLRRDLAKCAKAECRLCVEVCPMRVRILELPWEKFSDPECIYCMKCVDACPDKAIKLKYP
jgi:polyferredoxin